MYILKATTFKADVGKEADQWHAWSIVIQEKAKRGIISKVFANRFQVDNTSSVF